MGNSVRPPVCGASKPAAQDGRETSVATNSGTPVPEPLWFALMARELWQFKVAAHLYCLIGTNERTARAWARGDREPMGSAVLDLLRSSDGERVLDWIMRDSGAEWWRDLQGARALSAQFKIERR